jgi:molecular chaperone Hsp33
MPEGGRQRHADDIILPFRIGDGAISGRLVRLGGLADRILSRHAYPPAVGQLLGEALGLTCVLAGALKYDGVFTLQTKGDGPVRLLVADVNSDGLLRGYAEISEARAGEIPEGPTESPVPRLLGAGFLAFTVDQGPGMERYQGIVEMDGATLAECAHHYFRQSEQLESLIRLAAAPVGDGTWRAAALMLQRMPEEQADYKNAWDLDPEEREDAWRRAAMLLGTATEKEILDPDLSPEQLLYRLFHEDGVRVFQSRALTDECECGREKFASVLSILEPDEIEDLKIDGKVEVTCQFCSRTERFGDDELADLLAPKK